MPLPPEKAAQARRQARERAKKNGRNPSEKALYLSEWVVVVTSLPPALLGTEAIANLYRVLWQVELVIKRLKSLLQVDELRARKH